MRVTIYIMLIKENAFNFFFVNLLIVFNVFLQIDFNVIYLDKIHHKYCYVLYEEILLY